MVNVYINLTYLLHKEIVYSLERINIFMELFLRELYFTGGCIQYSDQFTT